MAPPCPRQWLREVAPRCRLPWMLRAGAREAQQPSSSSPWDRLPMRAISASSSSLCAKGAAVQLAHAMMIWPIFVHSIRGINSLPVHASVKVPHSWASGCMPGPMCGCPRLKLAVEERSDCSSCSA